MYYFIVSCITEVFHNGGTNPAKLLQQVLIVQIQLQKTFNAV